MPLLSLESKACTTLVGETSVDEVLICSVAGIGKLSPQSDVQESKIVIAKITKH